MRAITRMVGGLLWISSALGFLGFPSDAPTWYRCIRGTAPCPDSLSKIATADPATVWNVALFGLGTLLLVLPLRLRPRRQLEPTTEFYTSVRARLLDLQHEGLLLHQRLRGEEAPWAKYQSAVDWGTKVSRLLLRYFPGSNQYFTAAPTGASTHAHLDCYLERLSNILDDATRITLEPIRETMRQRDEAVRKLWAELYRAEQGARG